MNIPSPSDRLRVTLARIEEILASEEFASSPEAVQQYHAGLVLGVWDGKRYLIPLFQFNRDTGELAPKLEELIALLPKDASGWRAGFWLYQPHARLGGRVPAHFFRENPAAVVEAARSSFDPGDTNW
jgi:hypothetical protein